MTGHRWGLETFICTACGVTRKDIEDGKASAIRCVGLSW